MEDSSDTAKITSDGSRRVSNAIWALAFIVVIMSLSIIYVLKDNEARAAMEKRYPGCYDAADQTKCKADIAAQRVRGY